MKKVYLFFTLLLTALTFAQGSEDFTNSNATATYGASSFVGNGGITWTYSQSRDQGTGADDYSITGNGLMLRRASDSYLEATIPGGIGNLQFQFRKAFTGTSERQLEVLINGVQVATSVAFGTITGAESTIYDFNHNVNQPGSVVIRIKNVGTTTTNRQATIDNIVWTGFSGTPTPSIAITAPTSGATFSPETTSVNVNLSVLNFNVANGTGDGHIHYTINGGGVNMKYDTTPIVIPTTPGAYTIYAELVDNAHNPISPAQNATVNFTVLPYNVVANLLALRADVIANGVGKYYQVSSNPVITYARTARNQKYIQDGTAGILVDDLPGTISTPMINGDAISGLKGQASLFNGVLQLLPTTNAIVASSGNTITPQVVTAADISANIENYESELVQINNATFTAADGVATFVFNTNNTLNDGSDILFRTSFSEADYIGQVIPSGAANRVVLVAEFNGTAQVVSRSLTDVTLSRNSVNDIIGLKVYPNPATTVLNISSDSFADKNVEIYNVLGKTVLSSKVVSSQINVANLAKGVYVVKITEEGKTATRKLVIE